MRRQHEFINEFEPFTNSLRNNGPLHLLARFGLLPLLLPLAFVFAASSNVRASTRAGLLAALGASLSARSTTDGSFCHSPHPPTSAHGP